MKLQNLAIISIVILIPIILIVSYYLELQKSTLSMQMSYDQKLIESTKEAIEAFEINTTEWNENYSNLSDSKRRDVMASINTFITSLSGNLGIGGTSKENILSYIPAISFTLYDGYYVYAPAYMPVVKIYDEPSDKAGQPEYATDGKLQYKKSNGTVTTVIGDLDEEDYQYKHTLTTYLPYSERYGNYVVDYTLDNYIKVYGEDGTNAIAKSGNLVYFDSGTTDMNLSDIARIKYNGSDITPEILTEQIMFKATEVDGKQLTETYKYIYDVQNEKYYYEEIAGSTKEGEFFRVVDGEKIYLSDSVAVGDFSAKYRKIVVTANSKKIDVYELLNGKNREFYVDTDENGTLDERIDDIIENVFPGVTEQYIYNKVESVERYEDCSAINYYQDAHDFTKWVYELNIEALKISNSNNPENEDSAFAIERREVIKSAVQKTLNASITQYAEQTGGYEYKLINLKETDWDQLLRNASITTFFQGVPIGLKYYNSYAIATSTTNTEYINKDEIYFTARGDENYHNLNCEKIKINEIIGYRNTDYIRKKYTPEGETTKYYYYLHEGNNDSELACYDCLVANNSSTGTPAGNYIIPYYTALARERYVQNKNVKYVNGDLKGNLENWQVIYRLNGGTSTIGEDFETKIDKIKDISVTIKGSASKDNTDGFVYWWGRKTDTAENEYNAGNVYQENQGLTLTASYKIHLEYDGNGTGENVPGRQEGIDKGEGASFMVSSTEPVRTNYEFLGWATTPGATVVEYNPGDNMTSSWNTKLYAVWIKRIDNIQWKQDVIPKNSAGEYQYSMTFSNFAANGQYRINYGSPDKYETISTAQKGIEGGKVAKVFAIGNNGQDVLLIGNGRNAGRNAIWTTITDDIKEIKFSYNLDFGDNIDMAGVIFGISETLVSNNPTNLKGYYLRLNKSGTIDLCDITYKVKTENNNKSTISDTGTIVSSKSFNNQIEKVGNIIIKITNNSFEIKIEDTAGHIDSYTDNTSIDRKSFGFITNHYTHNCDALGMFKITNVQVFVEE